MEQPSDELPMGVLIDWATRHGFPTFDQFRKNPDKWRQRADELFESIDNSSMTFKKQIAKQKYMWRDTHECTSLEQVQRICKEEGYSPLDLEMEPRVVPLDGTQQNGRVEITVHFWPKEELALKGKVVPHVT